MANNIFNGRVNVLEKDYSQYVIDSSGSQSTDGYDIVSKNMAHTPISKLFFSKTNIDALQKGISNRVFNQTNGRYNIGNQSETELKIIMRSIYFDSLRGGIPMLDDIQTMIDPSCDTVLERVKNLNKKVLDWAVPHIVTNIQQFEKYKRDISFMPNPMDRPSFVSSAGSKSLEFQSFF